MLKKVSHLSHLSHPILVGITLGGDIWSFGCLVIEPLGGMISLKPSLMGLATQNH